MGDLAAGKHWQTYLMIDYLLVSLAETRKTIRNRHKGMTIVFFSKIQQKNALKKLRVCEQLLINPLATFKCQF